MIISKCSVLNGRFTGLSKSASYSFSVDLTMEVSVKVQQDLSLIADIQVLDKLCLKLRISKPKAGGVEPMDTPLHSSSTVGEDPHETFAAL